MSDLCQLYSEELSNDKKTISVLENELHEIRVKILKSNTVGDLVVSWRQCIGGAEHVGEFLPR